MDKINPNIILLGPQGSGKSTQSDFLIHKLDYQWISTGNLIREYVQNKLPGFIKINNIINSGKLIPNDILFDKIFNPLISKLNKNKPILFDGIPRNNSQLIKFNQIIDQQNIKKPFLFYLYIPNKTVFERVGKRLYCPTCKNNFKPLQKGYKNKKCPKCLTTLIKRQDDKTHALKQRLKIFHTQTKKVIQYYKNHQKFIKIDGTKSIKNVNKQILININKINENKNSKRN